MMYNCLFTSYRRILSSSKYTYSATATISNGSGFLQTLGTDMRAILGIANAVKAYILTTEFSDIQIADKFVINAENYHCIGIEDWNYNGSLYKKALLTKDA